MGWNKLELIALIMGAALLAASAFFLFKAHEIERDFHDSLQIILKR
jgi:hypothetical protein